MSRTFLPNLNISAFWLVGSSRNTHHRNAESSLRRPRPGSWLFFSFRETTWMPSDEAAVWEYGTADRLAAAASGVAKKLRKINPAERRQEKCFESVGCASGRIGFRRYFSKVGNIERTWQPPRIFNICSANFNNRNSRIVWGCWSPRRKFPI